MSLALAFFNVSVPTFLIEIYKFAVSPGSSFPFPFVSSSESLHITAFGPAVTIFSIASMSKPATEPLEPFVPLSTILIYLA
jgi:hypothetical protein